MKQCSENFEEELEWLKRDIAEHGDKMDKIVLFCKTIDTCQKIYNWLMLELDDKAYSGGEISIKCRLLEMYHRGTDLKSKERVLEAFRVVNSMLRVVICTIAFGMGVDIPNVRHVVLWGMPDSILDVWQLIGRCGRDGKSSLASCLFFPRSLRCMTCKSSVCKCPFSDRDQMIKVLHEKSCMRTMILNTFALNENMQAEIQISRDICIANNCQGTCLCPSCMCCTSCSLKCKCLSKFI